MKDWIGIEKCTLTDLETDIALASQRIIVKVFNDPSFLGMIVNGERMLGRQFPSEHYANAALVIFVKWFPVFSTTFAEQETDAMIVAAKRPNYVNLPPADQKNYWMFERLSKKARRTADQDTTSLARPNALAAAAANQEISRYNPLPLPHLVLLLLRKLLFPRFAAGRLHHTLLIHPQEAASNERLAPKLPSIRHQERFLFSKRP